MNRRQLLGIASGTVAVLGGGVLTQRAYASYRVKQQLMAQTLPVLTEKAHAEILRWPVSGREEIRDWFHQKCLDVAPWANYICSQTFRQQLSGLSRDDQERRLLVSFLGQVVTAAEIVTRVQTIAEEIGKEIDRDWADSCNKIASKWALYIREYDRTVAIDALLQRVESISNQYISEAINDARVAAGLPSISGTLHGIGESALMVMEMTEIRIDSRSGVNLNPFAQVMAVPTFVALALGHLVKFVCSLFDDPRGDIQTAVSGRVALLGNRTGSEFENELRKRLGNLHSWREEAVDKAAWYQAWNTSGWF